MSPEQFQHAVLAWYDQCGRRDLPWQQDINPYRVWVSEIMLQQTQVATVIPYYRRFMQHLPTLETLAAAPQDEILHLWTGLGYYSRAHNLKKAATVVTAEHGGVFPTTTETLIRLPGIGRSTAGAIIAIAHQRHAPILDGNVKRVLARFHAVEGWPGKRSVLQLLWCHAERYTPEHRVRDYTQAMMDLGSTVCTRSKPDCPSCPLTLNCSANRSGKTALFPGKKPRKTLPVRAAQFLIIENQHREVLLHKRPPSGIWSGLWIFPELGSGDDAAAFCRRQLLGQPLQLTNWPTLRHTFSHYHLDMQPVHIRVATGATHIMEPAGALWYKPSQPQSIGMAAPVQKLLRQLAARTAPTAAGQTGRSTTDGETICLAP